MTSRRVVSGSSQGLSWRLTVEPDGAEVVFMLEIPEAGRESRCRAPAVPPLRSPSAVRSVGGTGPQRILVWCHPSVRQVDVQWEERRLLSRRTCTAPIELHQVQTEGVSGKAGVFLLARVPRGWLTARTSDRRRSFPVRLSGSAEVREETFSVAI